MENNLERYNAKRNFSATPEPAGKARKRKSKSLSFVIQKHAASHLHYDFRLELDGTLKSWAVPKGPSLDPHDKRLAMEVEDHPLDYADFEGTIPAGNYGAGTVIVWDRGEWICHGDPHDALASGKLKFELRGEKLNGSWTLVKTRGPDRGKKNAWLLIKERDDEARSSAEFNVVEERPDSVLGGTAGRVWKSKRAPHAKSKAKPTTRASKRAALTPPKAATQSEIPLTLTPQLAMLVDTVPKGESWSYELKFDGYRILARIIDGDVRLFTRNGNDWTGKLKHLASALATLPVENAWLDGEVVIMGEDGRSNFQALQNAFENSRTSSIQYFLFDVPYCQGYDLRRVRLDERRAFLEKLLEKAKAPIFFSAAFDMPGAELFKNACALKLEGLIGKSKASAYQSTRSRDWVKLKCIQRQEFVIGGYTDSKRPGQAGFGSLLLGVHEKDGRLRYAGRVGTGFSQTSLQQLMAKLKPLQQEAMPFDEFTGERSTRAMHWVKPKLVCEVAFAEWTTGGHIRHSSFQGLRTDKQAGGITAELPVEAPRGQSPKTNTRAAKSAGDATTAGVTVTHGDRVIDPKTGTTKQQLVDFYRLVAPHLLAHLADRPVSLVRAPRGIDGQIFFQKHLDSVNVKNVGEVDRRYFPGHPPLIVVDSELGVLSCAQMNVIEFHTWNATLADSRRPDRLVFDLDPGEGIQWPQMQEAATLMKSMLDHLKLKSFLKTSGGKGLHVVVPITPHYEWDTVKEFSATIVRHLAKTLPMLFVATSGPRNRVGRIFIDYLRNGLGATTASAFSVRARPGLGVSIPVAWEELPDIGGGDHWTIANADERLGPSHKRVWSGYARGRQDLTPAMATLEFTPAAAEPKKKRTPSRKK